MCSSFADCRLTSTDKFSSISDLAVGVATKIHHCNSASPKTYDFISFHYYSIKVFNVSCRFEGNPWLRIVQLRAKIHIK